MMEEEETIRTQCPDSFPNAIRRDIVVPIEQVYPDLSWFSYNPLIESLGYSVEIQVDDSDYQGDSRLLLRDGDRWGVLIFGWGSCSGCDSLQACSTLAEVDELRKSIAADIKWFDSAKECLVYFVKHDWKGDFSWHANETREFFAKSVEMLSGEPLGEPTLSLSLSAYDGDKVAKLALMDHLGVEITSYVTSPA